MILKSLALGAGYAALLAVATGCSPPSRWKQLWDCWRGLNTNYYGCRAREPQPWFAWAREHEGAPEIYYKCVDTSDESDKSVYPFDPLEDYNCRPEGIPNKFNDGTTPSFHCFGTEDDGDKDNFALTCEPYWMLKSEDRRKKGSGWFYWLALQSEGEERNQFMQLAEEFATKNMNAMNATLDAMEKEAMKPAPGPAEIDQEIEKGSNRIRKDLNDLDAREKRTPEQVKAQMEAERQAWQSR